MKGLLRLTIERLLRSLVVVGAAYLVISIGLILGVESGSLVEAIFVIDILFVGVLSIQVLDTSPSVLLWRVGLRFSRWSLLLITVFQGLLLQFFVSLIVLLRSILVFQLIPGLERVPLISGLESAFFVWIFFLLQYPRQRTPVWIRIGQAFLMIASVPLLYYLPALSLALWLSFLVFCLQLLITAVGFPRESFNRWIRTGRSFVGCIWIFILGLSFYFVFHRPVSSQLRWATIPFSLMKGLPLHLSESRALDFFSNSDIGTQVLLDEHLMAIKNLPSEVWHSRTTKCPNSDCLRLSFISIDWSSLTAEEINSRFDLLVEVSNHAKLLFPDGVGFRDETKEVLKEKEVLQVMMKSIEPKKQILGLMILEGSKEMNEEQKKWIEEMKVSTIPQVAQKARRSFP